MVVAENLSLSIHQAPVGTGFDGVVRVSSAGFYGTGVLLYSGLAVLTAAHILPTDSAATDTAITVRFETTAGISSLTSVSFSILDGYDSENSNRDLVLVWLPVAAPVEADRYPLYRNTDEVDQIATLVGYGTSGTGDSGISETETLAIERFMALNQFDGDAQSLKDAMGLRMGWDPDGETILVADFDNGFSSQDALGLFAGSEDLGVGVNEGMIAPGDSGGPAFIDGNLAGIASYTATLHTSTASPDIDDESNSSFGEIGFWQRISSFQQWIDQTIRQNYVGAPVSSGVVQKEVIEGDTDASHAFFLVQFYGVRTSEDTLLSVDYVTRDGSAMGGYDYLQIEGTLVLYPGEDSAVIAVEIIGDRTVEGDETFYLDVFNPVGGSFSGGVETLSAMRTILDDDFGWA